MTMTYERTQALLRTRQLPQELADGARLEPDLLRRRAAALLRHYPARRMSWCRLGSCPPYGQTRKRNGTSDLRGRPVRNASRRS
jgi:hypothetical protein